MALRRGRADLEVQQLHLEAPLESWVVPLEFAADEGVKSERVCVWMALPEKMP